MKAKTKLGMGMKKLSMTKRKKRILSVAKRGGILPLLGVVRSSAGGTMGIAKAVNDSKAVQRQLEEMQRHNRAMEGCGLYFAPYKRGQRFSTKSKRKKKRRKNIKTTGATTNLQLEQLAKRMRIPFF